MITITNLKKAYGTQILFEGTNLQLNKGCCYGLVGANGSGKSTLLRIISGAMEPSEGSVAHPKRARFGVLSQDHFQYEDTPIIHVVMMGNRILWDAMVEKEALLENAHEHFDGDRYAELEDVVVRFEGYELESRAGAILEGLNIPTACHHEPLSTLSGGFKLRVLLAQTLAAMPDIMLLDEPTNHLDILSIRWLERFLGNFPGCTLVVSHDQRFLNNICSHILDVDYEQILLYTGNYDAFEKGKAEEMERKEREIAKQEKIIADKKAFVDRFRAKATKARQAQSRVKQIEKITVGRLPQTSRRYPRFSFTMKRPSGKTVLVSSQISKAFDDNVVLEDVGLRLRRGDRVAVIGPNGIGKSTLLKILLDELAPDSADIEWGHEVQPGYFAQDPGGKLKEDKSSLQDWVWNQMPELSIGAVRGNLAAMLFQRDEVEKKVCDLSGGEMARLTFLALKIQEPNLLVLDEPTNHLDIEGIHALVQALKAYEGTLLFVSHDRWFVSELATRVVEITENGVEDFPGSYDEYLAHCGDDHLDADAVVKRARETRKVKRS